MTETSIWIAQDNVAILILNQGVAWTLKPKRRNEREVVVARFMLRLQNLGGYLGLLLVLL